MSEANITIIPDNDLLRQAQSKLNKMGIDINNYFNTFLQSIVDDDFDAQTVTPIFKEKKIISFDDLPKEEYERRMNIINTKGHISEALGVLEGMIWMAKDFDEPLECMKEYME